MDTVIFDISTSLDGFVAGSSRRPEEPMGDGGERLHEWAMRDDSRDAYYEAVEMPKAIIAGRRTYDDSVAGWGRDGPSGPARLPVFVVSHGKPDQQREQGVYTFVNGIEPALRQAKAAAAGQNVHVMGGADIGQQFLRAGLIDEIHLHVVPVLFGSGMRLFEQQGDGHIDLETKRVINTPAAIHLLLRVTDRQ